MQDDGERASDTPDTTSITPWPITDREAALRLGKMSLRRLRSIARQHNIGKRPNRALMFSEAEFHQLYEALPGANEYGKRFIAPSVPMPSAAESFRRALKLLDERKRKRAADKVDRRLSARGKRILKPPKATT